MFILQSITVVTPSLNKSFKFQSDWPYNNSQSYLLESIADDIKEDEEREFKLINDGYEFRCKVNYPNNKKLVSQRVVLDKKLNIKTVEVKDSDGNTQIKMTFDKIDLSPKFNDDYFKLNTLLNTKIDNNDTKKESDNNTSSVKEEDNNTTENSTNGEENTKETATIEDIIYPMYLPENTHLTNQEKIDTKNGERLILTFEGDNPFILVEETIKPSENSLIIPTNGELEFLADVIGVVNTKSVSWDSNGIEYYVASDTLETSELINIAKSISVLPVSK